MQHCSSPLEDPLAELIIGKTENERIDPKGQEDIICTMIKFGETINAVVLFKKHTTQV